MKRAIVIALAWASALCPASAIFAESLDLQRLVQDTQRLRQQDNEIDLVWWIPSEYWQTVLENNRGVSPEQRANFVRVVDDYLVLAVLEGTFGPMGGISGTSKDELFEKTSVSINGHNLKALAESELSGDAQNLFQAMKPILGNTLGQMGKGLEFLVFEGKNEDGEKYATPLGEGFLTVHLGAKEFRYRLPLGSFLPSKYDPTTGEEFPGNYVYSPFTGTKLQTDKPKQPNDDGR